MINQRETYLIRYTTEELAAKYYKAACVYLGYEIDPIYEDIEDIVLPEDIVNLLEDAKTLPVPEVKPAEYVGINWSKQKQKWVSRFSYYMTTKKRGNITLGYYNDPYEAAIRRDIFAYISGLPKRMVIATEDDIHLYMEKFPREKIRKVQLIDKESGEVIKLFGGMTEIADTYHIDKRKMRAILEGKEVSKYKYDFKWTYVDKPYPILN